MTVTAVKYILNPACCCVLVAHENDPIAIRIDAIVANDGKLPDSGPLRVPCPHGLTMVLGILSATAGGYIWPMYVATPSRS